MTKETEQRAAVIQADRDRAADAVFAYRDTRNNNWQHRIRQGQCDDGEMVQAFARHRLAAQPAPLVEGERSPAQFFFEVGFGSCWAEAFVRNNDTPAFPLTDAIVERAWVIAAEAHDDPEEFDRYLAAANATPPAPLPTDPIACPGGVSEALTQGILRHISQSYGHRSDVLFDAANEENITALSEAVTYALAALSPSSPVEGGERAESREALIRELRNPWQDGPPMERGMLPDWAGALMQRAAHALAALPGER